MKKRLYAVVYMFVLTLFFTSVVSGVKVLNQERIADNERAKRQGVILDVLGLMPDVALTTPAVLGELFDRRVRTETAAGRTIYAAIGKDGAPSAYAFEVSGPGFWGPIEGMVAVSAAVDRVVGVNFFRHTETPGLGARITESWFRNQFKNVRLEPQSGKPFFRLVPQGTAEGPDELDAITGATETSRAVERFLNRELQDFLGSAGKAARGDS